MSTKKRDDEAFARLKAADPAAELFPDREALRAAVAARSESTVDELAVRRSRFPRALQVAAAGAGALVIGAGGFALGGGFAGSALAGGAGSGDAGAESVASASIDEGSVAELPTNDFGAQARPEGGDVGAPAPGPMGGSMAASGEDGRMAGDAAYLPWGGGRTVFSASGLSSSGGSAKAYGYDAERVWDEDRVAEVAAALGVEGEVSKEDGYFVVGDPAKGANLTVYADGSASFHFADPATDLWTCESSGDGECTERDLGDAPQGDEARDLAVDVLVKLGLDPASFELEVSDASTYESKDYSTVTAARTVEGKRTGDQYGVSFTGAGLQSAWGGLAELVELGDYSVVSPVEAVERLGDPRFGASNQMFPIDWIGPMARGGAAESQGSSGSLPAPGSSFAWPVENVTIVEASLGLSQQHLDGGTVVVLPSYELSSADGRSWTVVAVADKHLDF